MLDPIEQGFANLIHRQQRQIDVANAVLADISAMQERWQEDAATRHGILDELVAQVSEMKGER